MPKSLASYEKQIAQKVRATAVRNYIVAGVDADGALTLEEVFDSNTRLQGQVEQMSFRGGRFDELDSLRLWEVGRP